MEELLLIVGSVSLVLLVTSVSRRINFSAPLLLLVVGIGASYLPFIHVPELEPELVLVGFLPPLLYAAAINTSLVDFRTNIAAIGWLSVGFVLFCALGVGLVVAGLLPVPFAVAFALGAIVAPPDAVAAVAVARQAGLPRRVVTILEGESLINDATALVSLRTAIAAVGASVTVGGVALDFVSAVIGGLAAGFLIAKLSTWLFMMISDTVTSTALTFLIPFAAFALAESVHASGVLAVVIAGLLVGHAAPVVRSAPARISAWMNWTTVQYVLEHLVFLLIGLQAKVIIEAAARYPLPNGTIALVSAVVLITLIVLRVVYVMAIRPFLAPRYRSSNWREAFIISWAGMRGVVTLAAALTLPLDTFMRPVLILVALVAVTGTLLLHGLTLPLVARALRVRGPDPREDALQSVMVTQRAVQAGIEAVEAAATPGDEDLVEQLRGSARRRVDLKWERLGHHVDGRTEPFGMAYRRLRLAAIKAERTKVLDVRDKGFADHEVLADILGELDIEEATLITREEQDREIRDAPPRRDGEAPCVHLGAVSSEIDSDAHGECLECVTAGTNPVELRMCLQCGHIACCDSSPGRHAARHFRTTGHPVMRSIEPGEHWRWCYLDNLHDEGDDD